MYSHILHKSFKCPVHWSKRSYYVFLMLNLYYVTKKFAPFLSTIAVQGRLLKQFSNPLRFAFGLHLWSRKSSNSATLLLPSKCPFRLLSAPEMFKSLKCSTKNLQCDLWLTISLPSSKLIWDANTRSSNSTNCSVATLCAHLSFAHFQVHSDTKHHFVFLSGNDFIARIADQVRIRRIGNIWPLELRLKWRGKIHLKLKESLGNDSK